MGEEGNFIELEKAHHWIGNMADLHHLIEHGGHVPVVHSALRRLL